MYVAQAYTNPYSAQEEEEFVPIPLGPRWRRHVSLLQNVLTELRVLGLGLACLLCDRVSAVPRLQRKLHRCGRDLRSSSFRSCHRDPAPRQILAVTRTAHAPGRGRQRTGTRRACGLASRAWGLDDGGQPMRHDGQHAPRLQVGVWGSEERVRGRAGHREQ